MITNRQNLILLAREIPMEVAMDGEVTVTKTTIGTKSCYVVAKSNRQRPHEVTRLVSEIRFDNMEMALCGIIEMLFNLWSSKPRFMINHLSKLIAEANGTVPCLFQPAFDLIMMATGNRLLAMTENRCYRKVTCYDITFDQASSYYDFVMLHNRRICIQCAGLSPVVMIAGLVLRIPAISLDTNTQIVGNAIFEGKKLVNEKDFPIVFRCETKS